MKSQHNLYSFSPFQTNKRRVFYRIAGFAWITGLAVITGCTQPEHPDSNTHQAAPAPVKPLAGTSAPLANMPVNLEQRLFAAHFQPYQSNELNSLVQTAPDQSPFRLFGQAYLDGQYAEVLRRFENLTEDEKNNGGVLFLRANALLAIGQSDAAIGALDKICAEKMSRYLKEAQWYLAMAWLQKGTWKQAEKVFLLIKTTQGHPYAARATVILNAYSRRSKTEQ